MLKKFFLPIIIIIDVVAVAVVVVVWELLHRHPVEKNLNSSILSRSHFKPRRNLT
jgi:hypothetical protein